ncbi:DUF4307 domain-containing protein [Streptomyces sp. NPDC002073]|uniref:DUF4307 domain-containing protein n=1 Tax=Streptomyces sp. NBC_00239 TaxID=2903640 RepID=UPI002E2E319E|nr:DUF4307 domain-containing protein [Streptomyces sp. NBC_00239]
MSAVRESLPEGRYGRSEDERADRKLKIVGSLLGVGLLGLVGWIGYDYVGGQTVSGQVITFRVVSDSEVRIQLEIHKDTAAIEAVCTVNAQDRDHADVGRADFSFDAKQTRLDETVVLKTTSRATSAELVSCQAR